MHARCNNSSSPSATSPPLPRRLDLTPYVLAILAVLLAWPIPLWLQRAQWPSRAPGPALILWQAIGLSGGLSLVTAPLTWGLQPFGSGLISATQELWNIFRAGGIDALATDPRWHPLGLAAVTLGCIIFCHLALVLIHTTYRTVMERKRHREFVEILSASLQRHEYGLDHNSHAAHMTRVLPVDHPLAYCLPAVNQPLTIVSQGLLDELSPDQLSAVLTHEAAHLQQRHDLLRLAFQAWHKAAPWFPATGVAVAEVTDLTEILADDAALTHHKPADLAAALAHTTTVDQAADNTTSPTEPHTDGTGTDSRRVRRLLEPSPPLSKVCTGLVLCLTIALVLIPAFVSLV